MKKYFTCKIYKTIIWSKKVINIYESSSDESKRQRLKHGSIQRNGISLKHKIGLFMIKTGV